MEANQSAPGFNRGLTSDFWWLRSAKYVKFIEEHVMYTKKDILVKNVFK